MRVQFLKQAWPKGGGLMIPAGVVVDLDPEVLSRYPPGSWRRVTTGKRKAGVKDTESPRKKPATAPVTK